MAESSGWWSSGDFSSSGSGMEQTLDNSTALSCEALLVKGRPLPISMTTTNTLRYIQVVYYIMLLITGTALNSFVIFIIVRFKKLHTITFYLALQIIITNQINALIVFPSTAANVIASEFVFTGLCPTLGFTITLLRSSRNIQMLVLVADRFSLIFMPFWYTRHRVKIIVPLIMASWVLAFILVLIPVPGLLDCYGFQRFTWTCLITNGCKNPTACASHRTFVTTFLNIGTFIGFLLYLALLCKAKKLRNRVDIAPPSEESAEVRDMIKRQRRSERRANTTFLIMFTALVGMSLPSYLFFSIGNAVLLALNVLRPPSAYAVFAVISRSLFSMLIIIDPIVIMRNQDFAEVTKDILAKIRSKRAMMTSSRIDQSDVRTSDNATQNLNQE